MRTARSSVGIGVGGRWANSRYGMKRVTCQGVSGPSSAAIQAAMPRERLVVVVEAWG